MDLVLLPDEPYVFTAEDGPEAFPRTETRLVSGRLLTWYGPSLLEAPLAARVQDAAGVSTSPDAWPAFGDRCANVGHEVDWVTSP